MKTDLAIERGVLHARPDGPRLDLAAAGPFKAALKGAISADGELPDRLVIDLSAVRYLDSAGLGALLSVLKKARRFGIPVGLQGATGEVAEILELTLVTRIFEMDAGLVP
jgi:anti-sigma B factor antagonist